MSDTQYLGQVLTEFFGPVDVAHIQARLFEMANDVRLGRMALLPRAELAQRAVLAEDMRLKIGALYQAIIAEYTEHPGAWELPDPIKLAVGDLLALYFANTPIDHSSYSGVEPVQVGEPVRRPARRRPNR